MTNEQSVDNSNVEAEKKSEKKTRSPRKRQTKASAVTNAEPSLEGQAEQTSEPAPKRRRTAKTAIASESGETGSEVKAKTSRSRKSKSQVDAEGAPQAPKSRARVSRKALAGEEPALEQPQETADVQAEVKTSQTKKTRVSKKTEAAKEKKAADTANASEESVQKPKRSTRSRSAKKNEATQREPASAKEETTTLAQTAELPKSSPKTAEEVSTPQAVQEAQVEAERVSSSLAKLVMPVTEEQLQPQAPVEQEKSAASESGQETGEQAQAPAQESVRLPRRHHRGRRRPQSRLGVRASAETQESRQKEEPAEPIAQPKEASEEETVTSPDIQLVQSEFEDDSEFWDLEEQETGRDARSRKKDLQQPRKLNRKMFFSVLAGERVEVALSAEGKLSEYYLDMQHQKKLKGNIYKGIIQNIDTNLQAAFVNYGTQKNGFLQIDEIHSEYWLSHYEPTKGNKFPPIQKVVKPGQEVLVQVVKEPTGNKGAFLTTWLSLAGRFLVLTPGQDQIGVSRKVVDEAERTRLKELISGIDPGEDIGVIVRTVSAGTTKTTLKNDLQYLKRIWRDIRKKGTEMQAPCLIYTEPSLVERSVRDYLTEDVTEIWADDENVAETVRNMVNLLFPRKKDLVHLFSDKKQSLWDRFNLRRQIEQVYSREVFLPSGGRLVFDQTEALMAVDVNSGKISCKGNFEAMAYRTNMEAAESIARQLRLRDVGGQVVIDFIEMRDKKHVEDVERNLRLAMKSDKARYDIEHMSSFGLLELVRQRTGFSALSITQEPCPYCSGTGQRRNLEWQSLQVASDIQRQMRLSKSPLCVYETSAELGMYLLNHKREMLQELEQEYGKKLEIAIHHNS